MNMLSVPASNFLVSQFPMRCMFSPIKWILTFSRSIYEGITGEGVRLDYLPFTFMGPYHKTLTEVEMPYQQLISLS